MYLDHFNLRKPPFQSKPDPEFLYLSKNHARAKAYLEYTVWNKDGLAVISGEIGAGKTTLINQLVAGLDNHILTVKIHQTQLTEEQFLQTLLAKFGIEAFDANKANLLKLLNDFFIEQHAQGRKVLLIVDEAHHLGREILEEIRFLTGIEIEDEEIFTCILVGHTELMDILDAPGMEQLSQRVRLRCHIPGLSEEEIRGYINHRMQIAGCNEPDFIFPDAIIPLIYQYTGGIPRLINVLCDASMIAAYAEDVEMVDYLLIKTAIEELQWVPYQARQHMKTDGIISVVSEGRRPRIILTQNGEIIEEIQLDKKVTSIGRGINNDITLSHNRVSRYHAQITVDQDQVVLEDLQSINGTYVNGKRTQTYPLQNRDRIKITPFELVLVTNPSHQTSDETTKLMMVPVNTDLQ